MEQEEAEQYIFNATLDDVDREYVMELTTYSLQRLEKEPEYLSSEKKRLDTELEDVTVDNLSIFLQTSSTVNESQNLVHSMQSHVDDIILTVPDLITKSKEFNTITTELRNKRKTHRQMVSNQMRVLEILELPQLMWKCARSKLYSEALDLETYALDLYNRNNKNIPILKQLILQMKKTQKYILNELLISLEKSIQLPQCLKIIGYLTRMNVFDNNILLLRKEFLYRRLKYLQSLLPKQKNIINNTTDAYDYLSKFIDLYRMHIFAIVTQYKAIFVDENFMHDDKNDNNNNRKQKRSLTEDLLVIWCHKRVIHILTTIEKLLPLVSTGSFLNSLAQTCDYCGQSLGHIGMDYRGLLPPIFEKQIINLFRINCNNGILQFQSSLTSHDWFVTVEILSTMNNKEEIKEKKNNIDIINVPQILLQYPPLAVLTNGFIKAFNELREFVTYSVMMQCKEILINSIQSTVNCIRKFSVSSHHYYNENISNDSNYLRMRRANKRKKKKMMRQNKNNMKNKPDSVKDERRRSMVNVSTELDNDIKESKDENDNNMLIDDIEGEEDEIDEVLSNLVKVECEYLLPFLCDIFDMLFERTKEIEIDDLLQYFAGLYKVPQFTTISDDDIHDDDDNQNDVDKNKNKNDNDNESNNVKIEHIKSNRSIVSDISELENVTFVNNDVDETVNDS